MNAALKNFCHKKDITICYTAPYMYKTKKIAEQCWKTLAIIKDLLLIDNGLLINFWVEAIDKVNYSCKQLLTKYKSHESISEEAWTNTRQNLKCMYIFEGRMSILIPDKKRTKLDMRKTWKNFLISYTRISIYLGIWAPCTLQVSIPSKPIVNKIIRGIYLFIAYLLSISYKLLKLWIGEPKA